MNIDRFYSTGSWSAVYYVNGKYLKVYITDAPGALIERMNKNGPGYRDYMCETFIYDSLEGNTNNLNKFIKWAVKKVDRLHREDEEAKMEEKLVRSKMDGFVETQDSLERLNLDLAKENS